MRTSGGDGERGGDRGEAGTGVERGNSQHFSVKTRLRVHIALVNIDEEEGDSGSVDAVVVALQGNPRRRGGNRPDSSRAPAASDREIRERTGGRRWRGRRTAQQNHGGNTAGG